MKEALKKLKDALTPAHRCEGCGRTADEVPLAPGALWCVECGSPKATAPPRKSTWSALERRPWE